MSKRRLEEAEVEDVDVRDDEEEEEEEPAAAAGEDGAASSPTSPGGAGKRKEDAGRYQFLACVREDHGKAIYSVAFAPRGEHQNYFATIGANRATVYEVLPSGTIDIAQVYLDEDPEEVYYTCAWAIDGRTGDPLLAIAGLRGVIKVINCTTQSVVRVLLGHGNSINDLRFHPLDSCLLLSVSKDESLRLWNVTTKDFHMLGNCFASAGMDNTIKIWALDGHDIVDAIKESYSWSPAARCDFRTRFIQFPAFSTSKVHNDYVDSVRWVGNLLLSKSTENKVVLWCPDTRRGKDAVTIVKEFYLSDANIWYLRMSVDPTLERLSVGNSTGKCYVWDIDHDPSGHSSKRFATLSLPQCRHAVRQTAFSADGQTLLYVCDNSTIWRWDLIK